MLNGFAIGVVTTLIVQFAWKNNWFHARTWILNKLGYETPTK